VRKVVSSLDRVRWADSVVAALTTLYSTLLTAEAVARRTGMRGG
jgi:hypothetical protein